MIENVAIGSIRGVANKKYIRFTSPWLTTGYQTKSISTIVSIVDCYSVTSNIENVQLDINIITGQLASGFVSFYTNNMTLANECLINILFYENDVVNG